MASCGHCGVAVEISESLSELGAIVNTILRRSGIAPIKPSEVVLCHACRPKWREAQADAARMEHAERQRLWGEFIRGETGQYHLPDWFQREYAADIRAFLEQKTESKTFAGKNKPKKY